MTIKEVFANLNGKQQQFFISLVANQLKTKDFGDGVNSFSLYDYVKMELEIKAPQLIDKLHSRNIKLGDLVTGALWELESQGRVTRHYQTLRIIN